MCQTTTKAKWAQPQQEFTRADSSRQHDSKKLAASRHHVPAQDKTWKSKQTASSFRNLVAYHQTPTEHSRDINTYNSKRLPWWSEACVQEDVPLKRATHEVKDARQDRKSPPAG